MGKSKVGKVSQQTGDSGRSGCCRSSLKGTCCRVLPCVGEVSLLFYVGLHLIGWGASTLWRAAALLKIHWLKRSSHPKRPHRNIHKNVGSPIWVPWPCQPDTSKSLPPPVNCKSHAPSYLSEALLSMASLVTLSRVQAMHTDLGQTLPRVMWNV